MGKTPSYIKKAVNDYREKFDFIQVRFPKGTKEKLQEKGNINDYITRLVLDDLGKDNFTMAADEKIERETKND